ncbi:aminotransferase class I/II-fold pyridoxal phosphate-dependent enzyme [Natribacillus halophilus]|uniref:Arginine/lysine/ornithine decarboxylase n=1 Tax=Natribacillus halophilus TaxID=549003 RepID=A0A1G8SXY1_9BACI|nr:aminotransferase class I/II-fold pyridoxal phosphate-dependent enzyme [Natribacillus halophilus]SDJ34081.1 Arginine/lysine/ornithine decarboxylase [Natribacillus halophilus]
MDCPLFEQLFQHDQRAPISMHVPGHKNGNLLSPPYSTYFEQIMRLDQTELPGLDDLHDSSGVILEAERLAARQYGCARTFFLVGGSTLGNLTMILAFFHRGEQVLVQRDVHQSVVHGLEMAGVEAIFIAPEIDRGSGLATGVSEATVAQGFACYPEARGLLLSSPSYYGYVGELEGAMAVAKRNGAHVLVDEAHGAHLHIDSAFPVSALAAGADAVVQSAHKTLPALTMGAFLHLRSKADESRCRYWLQRLQTSSPSYPVLASLDVARAYNASLSGESIAAHLQAFRGKLDESYPGMVVENDDPLKLILRVPDGWNGSEWEAHLHTKGIYPELSDRRHVLLVLPLQHPRYWEGVLLTALIALYEKEQLEDRHEVAFPSYPRIVSHSFREEHRDTELIAINAAEGRKMAEEIIPYPPGIPLWIVGEAIDGSRLQFLQDWLATGRHVQASSHIHEGYLLVQKEVNVSQLPPN